MKRGLEDIITSAPPSSSRLTAVAIVIIQDGLEGYLSDSEPHGGRRTRRCLYDDGVACLWKGMRCDTEEEEEEEEE